MRFKGILVAIFLVWTSSVAYGTGWSWGSDDGGISFGPSGTFRTSSGSSSSSVATSLGTSSRARQQTPTVPLHETLIISSSNDTKFPETRSVDNAEVNPEDDREARLLGLNEKLCKLGIGFNCRKPLAPLPNTIPLSSYANVPYDVPFPVPQKESPYNPHSIVVPPQPYPGLPVVSQPQIHTSGIQEVHHHTHTHVHHVADSNSLPSPGPGIVNPGHFQPPHPIPGPVHGSFPSQQFPAYREECTCIHSSYCIAYDIVPRSNSGDIRNLIDARNRGVDTNSNSTGAEDKKEDVVIREDEAAKQTTSRRAKVLALVDSKNDTRVKRDTLVASDAAVNATNDAQGRRLSYIPGVTGCGAAYVCCRNPQLQQPQPRHTCGLSQSSGIVGRIKNPHYVNGDTEFGEYPWHAAILTIGGEYVCGGALIDDKHILTAAHCVNSKNPQELKIRLGDWDVSGPHEFYQHLELPVSFVVSHPQYYAGNLQNDIAVIGLHGYVDFAASPHISPVCLPERSYNYFVGQTCKSTGWGKNAFGNHGKFQTILKEVELPIVEHHQCEAALRHTRLGYQFSLQEGMMCAGGEQGRDTCQGDGGGPLVCAGADGRSHLAGLVSWGIGCGENGLPGVYVNVAHYLQWIQSITRAV